MGARHASLLPDFISALLDDFSPLAIEDLTPLPLPPGGLWDPTLAPAPDSPPSPLNWRVFFSATPARDNAAAALRAAHPDLSLTIEEVADEDWAARSQRQLRAISAGRFVVAPPWDIPRHRDPSQTVIVIEPSHGFGTGHHASTRLGLRALSKTELRGFRVLDLGTGSGVLAIAAALEGAARVVAIDSDPDAIDAARASHALNPSATGIDWLTGDFRDSHGSALATGCSQLVLANLTGGMLRASADRIRQLLAPCGLLIASGFDESERAFVQDTLQLTERATLVEEGWVGLVLVKT